jgi:hypothetical protein
MVTERFVHERLMHVDIGVGRDHRVRQSGIIVPAH